MGKDFDGSLQDTARYSPPEHIRIQEFTEDGSTHVWISWLPVDGASGYKIYRASSNFTSDYDYLGSASAPFYWDKSFSYSYGYYYKITTLNSGGKEGPLSTVVHITSGSSFTEGDPGSFLFSPGTVTAELETGGSGVRLSWSPVSGAEGYRILRFRKDGNDGEDGSENKKYKVLETVAAGVVTYLDTGASGGNSYLYGIAAVNSGGLAGHPAFQSIDYIDLDAPAGLTATLSGTTVNLYWLTVSGASSYKVYRSDSTPEGNYGEPIGTPSATSYTNYGVSLGTTYYYKVRAVTSDGKEGPLSDYASTTGLSAPDNLNATAWGSSVSLSWDTVSGASSYKVRRSNSMSGIYAIIGTPTAASYTDSNLPTGTYYYRVSAVSSTGGESSMSDYDSVVVTDGVSALGAPTGLTVTSSSESSISLSWNAVSGASSYRVYRNTSSYGTYTLINTSTYASYTDYDVSTGTTYYYKVSAVSSSENESPQSEYVSATAVNSGGGISNISYSGLWTLQGDGRYKSPAISDSSTTKMRINFTSTAGASIVIQLDVSSESGCDFAFIGQLDNASATYNSGQYSGSVISGTQSVPVTITIPVPTSGSHFIDIGYRKDYSEYRGSDCAWFKVIPSAPTGLTVTSFSGSSISLSWNAVSGASYYKVYRSTISSGTYTVLNSPDSASYTDYSISAGTTYYYKVSAVSSGEDESPQSEYVSATAGLSAPSGLTATPSGNSIGLSWNAVSGASYYKVHRSTISSGTYTVLNSPDSASYTDYDVSTGTTYYYKVSAVSSGGDESPQSEYVSATVSGISNISYSGLWTLQGDGRYKSPAISNISTTKMRINFTSTAGASIVIQLDVSSEENFDFAFISQLDNASATYDSGQYSGSVISGTRSVPVTIPVPTAGSHFIDIGYRKDGSGDRGSDCAWFKVIE